MDKKNESFEIDWKLEGFWEAAGEIPYTATNDFMFHMLMQENMEILRSFLSAVLRVEEDTISDIEVSNPINRGSSIDDKTLVLDIKVIVNHSLLIITPAVECRRIISSRIFHVQSKGRRRSGGYAN